MIRSVPRPSSESKIWQVIAASAVGTMIEWYDFYIFGSLATVISPLFYPSRQRHARAHRVSLDVRRRVRRPAVRRAVLRPHRRSGRPQVRVPRHARHHGRRHGADRRAADLRVHRHGRAGRAALDSRPAGPGARRRVRRRGGVRGRARAGRPRGFYTSFIQITATLGLFLSLAVILIVQNTMSARAFARGAGASRS